MPKKIVNFEEKTRYIVETVQRNGGRISYESLYPQLRHLKVWRTNPSEAITGTLIRMAKEKMINFLDRNGEDTTENVLALPDEVIKKKIRSEDTVIKLNIQNEYVERLIKSFGVFEVPEHINKEYYDFIASADILASRFGSVAVLWEKTIIVEVTGHRIWMGIRRDSGGEIRFFYVMDGESIPIPRMADLIEKSLQHTGTAESAFMPNIENVKIHFYSEVPYNSGFIISSAIATLLTVGAEYLMNRNRFREALLEEKCITGKAFDEFLNRHDMFENAVKMADGLYMHDRGKIPSATSTSAEYLLLFGTSKPANVICYRNKGNKMKPEVHPYYFEKPLFTDIWTGVGHDFPELLRSINRRSRCLPDSEMFFEKVADDLYKSMWRYGKAGLDMIHRGLGKGENEEISKGFDLLKVAIYEQICNSLRFTYRYFSYPHIATITQILAQHNRYGSPVGVGCGGFFQLLNENFREDREFTNMLLEVCRDWCLFHGGRIVRNLPYILPKRDNRFFWGIVVHRAT